MLSKDFIKLNCNLKFGKTFSGGFFGIQKHSFMKIFFSIILSLICFSEISFAQEQTPNYIFNYLTVKDGLSNNFVSKVVSDSLNVKWIATENGLTKFDGNSYHVIRPSNKYTELENENIETLFVDSKNNLWIGTKSGGLSLLEIATHKLSNVNSILSKSPRAPYRIMAIEEDNHGDIWVVTHLNGIYVINPVKKELVRHFNINSIRFMTKDSKGDIWFCKGNSLKRFNTKTQKMRTYDLGVYTSGIIEDDKNECLWMGCVNMGKHSLIKLDLKTESITIKETNISATFTSALYLDTHNRLWVGTWGNGLYRSDSNFENFTKVNLVYPPNVRKANNFETILDIHQDKDNSFWLSTGYGGIVVLNESKGFKNLDQFYEYDKLVGRMNFRSLYKFGDEIFFGTWNKGLFYGREMTSLKHLKITKNQHIKAISEHNNQLLVALDSVAYVLGKDKNIVATLKIPKATAFYSENKKELWVGTQMNGLFKVTVSDNGDYEVLKTFSSQDITNKIESMRIASITKDAMDNLWVGTYNGLHLYNRETDSFIHYSELIDEKLPVIINSIYTDDEYLWLGTPNGLYKMLYHNERLEIQEIYDAENFGLNNDFICGIVADNQSYIWLTTSTNLIRFNKFDETFINFSESDGVYASSFNLRSLYSDINSSMIYCGGTDNLTYFNSEEIYVKEEDQNLIFTNLEVANNKVMQGDIVNKHVILEKDFNYTSFIELSHLEKSFSVAFSNTNHFKNPNTHYRYKLIGFSDDWNYIKDQNEVSFVGLSPGSYELQVCSSVDYKNWSTPKALKIDILYAPWSSPFAFVGYSILLIFLVGSFTYIVLRQLRLKETLDKEKELSDAKFTFFTNISHEFRTPLTLILGPIKEMIQEQDLSSNLSSKLVTVEKNANRLLNLINQLLDFRKAEHGLLKLNKKPGNFARFANEVYLYFKEQARIKNIEYNFHSEKEEILFPFDRNKMEIVLCNIISNALKYTNTNGIISLRISNDKEFCTISIKDSGIGLNKKSKSKIFDRYYQIKSTNTSNVVGSGIGLSFTKKIVELHSGTIEVESELNKGTEFIIKIPLNTNVIANKDHEQSRYSTEVIENYKELESMDVRSLNITSFDNSILVIDDNEEIRNYLKQLLQNEYKIFEAKDGVEGVKIATNEMPDLILCDIMMPEKDGLEVCKDLKNQISTSHIPIMLLTARSANMYELQGLEIGADDFITKPFDPQVIKARISSVLTTRAKTREYFLNKVRFEPTTSKVGESHPEGAFIEKAIAIVEEHMTNEDFDIQSLMEKLHMSQSTLYRKIKSLTGLSLTGFIRSVRLKNAAELILASDDKLNAIAYKVGFSDYKHFKESFKKQFDCLPSEFKTKINNIRI